MVARKRRGWNQFTVDEKLDAIQADLMTLFDHMDEQERRNDKTDAIFHNIGVKLYDVVTDVEKLKADVEKIKTKVRL